MTAVIGKACGKACGRQCEVWGGWPGCPCWGKCTALMFSRHRRSRLRCAAVRPLTTTTQYYTTPPVARVHHSKGTVLYTNTTLYSDTLNHSTRLHYSTLLFSVAVHCSPLPLHYTYTASISLLVHYTTLHCPILQYTATY